MFTETIYALIVVSIIGYMILGCGDDETARAKMKIMSECGIYVCESPSDIGMKMKELLILIRLW